jgi:multidrug efflux pump
VIALFIMVLGGVAIKQLPIAQYPTVAPPSIVVSVAYPGASAQTLEDSSSRHRTRDERRARA